MERLLSVEEFAAIAHTTPATVRYWVHTGYAPRSAKVGRRRVWREGDVTDWLDAKFENDGAPAA